MMIMSFGSLSAAVVEYKAIERARDAGHIFSTSAGNDNRNTDKPK